MNSPRSTKKSTRYQVSATINRLFTNAVYSSHDRNKKKDFGDDELLVSLAREGKWLIENEPKYHNVVHRTENLAVTSHSAIHGEHQASLIYPKTHFFSSYRLVGRAITHQAHTAVVRTASFDSSKIIISNIPVLVLENYTCLRVSELVASRLFSHTRVCHGRVRRR